MLRKKMAQMLLMGFDGLTLEPENPARSWLNEEEIGGVLLFDYDLSKKTFGKNIETVAQIKALNQSILDLAPTIPPFITLDYEGGAVDRLKHIVNCPKTVDAKTLAAYPIETQNKAFTLMAKTLQYLQFNLNFAPVVDLNLTENDGIIGKLGRSYSNQPEIIAEYAARFVHIFNQYGIICCYKHFPGHGSAIGDTHLECVDVTESFMPQELEPYKILIQNVSLHAMIMTAHVINQQLDPKGIPATLSSTILTDLLRNQLHYEGIIISDDLQMQAIANHYTLEEALKKTIHAGADMVIFGNQLGSISATTILDVMERLVLNKEISEVHITKAYERIIAYKKKWFA